jgi:hypothetical protein
MYDFDFDFGQGRPPTLQPPTFEIYVLEETGSRTTTTEIEFPL